MKKSGLAAHCHHYILFEYCYDYDERVKFIKEYKPKSERKLRLRLFKIVPEDLIPGRESIEYLAWDKAREAYDKALKGLHKTREACGKAWKAYNAKYEQELIELHEKLCPDCPWNGETIFPDS